MTGLEMADILFSANIENAANEVRILLEELCGSSDMYEDLTDPALISAVMKRAEGYPLQYILGKWWFWDCEFKVSPDCLIPRSDTETIVEWAIKLLPQGAIFADVCAGSGCIGISILHTRRDLRCDAYELYRDTLDIALKNAKLNNVDDRYRGYIGDALSCNMLRDKKYSAIISNPPYIPSSIIPTLDHDVSFEPKAALDGGDDGLEFYRAMIKNFGHALTPDGRFIFEIGYDQAESLRILAKENGFFCDIFKDLCKNDRCAILYKTLDAYN